MRLQPEEMRSVPPAALAAGLGEPEELKGLEDISRGAKELGLWWALTAWMGTRTSSSNASPAKEKSLRMWATAPGALPERKRLNGGLQNRLD